MEFGENLQDTGTGIDLNMETTANDERIVSSGIFSHFSQDLLAQIPQDDEQNVEQQLEPLLKEHDEPKSKLSEFTGKLELAEKHTTELQNQVGEARSEASELEEHVQKRDKNNGELGRDRDAATDQKSGLQLQVEHQDEELKRLRATITALNSQLRATVTAKCQALANAAEIRSREMALNNKVEHLEKERTLLSQQMANLQEELAKGTEELQNFRSETSKRCSLMQMQLSQGDEELRKANSEILTLREAHSVMKKRCKQLGQKLEEQRSHELALHDSYQEEINAQTRLADLYKDMADVANNKAEAFISAVKELQGLLEKATEKYGLLETRHIELQIRSDETIAENWRKIAELEKQLNQHSNFWKSFL